MKKAWGSWFEDQAIALGGVEGMRVGIGQRPGVDRHRPLRREPRIERFSIVAWSFGCAYALNCAAWLRDRVTGLDLVSSPAPVERQTFFTAYGKTVLTSAALVNLLPGIATLVARGLHASAQKAHALVQELEVFLQPWPFELYEIRQPITLWAGGSDPLMHSELSEYLKDALKRSELRLLPEGTHRLIYPLQERILSSALGKALLKAASPA